MTLYEFVYAVACIADSKPTYRLGGKGADGTCDCIGLIIGAVERCGVSWTGIHGSNWAARNATSGLVQVTNSVDLNMGDIVYKARTPGSNGYSLPSRYDTDADRRDYYHVGVVTSVAPLEITHCTTGGGVDGIKVDTSLGKWTYRGRLSLIEGEDETATDAFTALIQPGDNAVVTAQSGKTVNLRESANKGSKLIRRIPLGTEVEVLDVADGWARVRVPVEGYIMTDYLRGGDTHG